PSPAPVLRVARGDPGHVPRAHAAASALHARCPWARPHRPCRRQAERVVADRADRPDARDLGSRVLACRDGSSPRADRIPRHDTGREPRVQPLCPRRAPDRADTGDARVHEPAPCHVRSARHVHRVVPRILRHEPSPHAWSDRGQVGPGGRMTQTVTTTDQVYTQRLTRITLIWVLTALVLFPVLAILGFFMRGMQAGFMPSVPPACFYAVMTLPPLRIVRLLFL